MRLNQKTIAGVVLPAGKSELVVFDEDLPGFGLRIRASGARSWVYQFKIGRRSRRITLGMVTAISPAKARAAAAEMHAQARLGNDPSQAKIDSRTQASVEEALRNYLTYQRPRLKPRSYTEVERHLLKHCKPLNSLPLAKVDRRVLPEYPRTQPTTATSPPTGRVPRWLRSSLGAYARGCSTAIR